MTRRLSDRRTHTRPPDSAGFGLATVLPVLLGSFYGGAAAVGVLFPLWIMMAADARPPSVRSNLPPLPVFRSACWLTNRLLGNLSLVPRIVALLGLERGRPARPAAQALSETSSMETRHT